MTSHLDRLRELREEMKHDAADDGHYTVHVVEHYLSRAVKIACEATEDAALEALESYKKGDNESAYLAHIDRLKGSVKEAARRVRESLCEDPKV